MHPNQYILLWERVPHAGPKDLIPYQITPFSPHPPSLPPSSICLSSLSHSLSIFQSTSHHFFITLQQWLAKVTVSTKEIKGGCLKQSSLSWKLNQFLSINDTVH